MKKFVVMSMIGLSLVGLTGCGNKITQSSLQDHYYEIEEQGEKSYVHFTKNNKIEMSVPVLGEALPKGKYKVTEEGKEAKMKMTILGESATVTVKKTKDGISIDGENYKEISKSKGEEIFE